jgi:hypothetical protein
MSRITLSEYNRDQIQSIHMVRSHLKGMPSQEIMNLRDTARPYMGFRGAVDNFQKKHLSGICTQKCFSDMKSACCNREGIATFFADVVINALFSSHDELDALEMALSRDMEGFKCVYLSDKGCLWKLKPIVCEMFLCEHARLALSGMDGSLLEEWDNFRKKEREFTWPDRPILFDELEKIFIKAGLDSPIMYFHKSPGLLRIKKDAGIE